MIDAAPFIQADVVYKRFGRREVLQGVYFAARPGRVTTLLGPNGCGKSTLLKILAGVLKPDQGRLVYDAGPLNRAPLHTLSRRGLFFLPQGELLLPNMPVRSQLSCFIRDPKAGASLIRFLDLDPLLDARPMDLSGGEKRLCELAAAFISQPRCLLIDEPFTGLAPIDAEKVSALLRNRADRGCTIVATDHSIEWSLSIADDLWLLEGGTCQYLGNLAQAMENADLWRCYLGAHVPRFRSGFFAELYEAAV